MNRQPEPSESVQYIQYRLSAPVSLMLMRLYAYRRDRNSHIQAALDELFVLGRCIEIVEQEHCFRICLMRRIENSLHQRDLPVLLAHSRYCIIVLIENGHDDNFIDDIPHVYGAFEACHLAVYASYELLQYRLVVIVHEPVGAHGMPDKRVTFADYAALREILRSLHPALGLGFAFFRFEPSEIEGQCGVIEHIEPLVHSFLIEGSLILVLGPVIAYKIKTAASEQELMTDLFRFKTFVRNRIAQVIRESYNLSRLPVFKVCHDVTSCADVLMIRSHRP